MCVLSIHLQFNRYSFFVCMIVVMVVVLISHYCFIFIDEDKCFQLRPLVQAFNLTASKMFSIGEHVCFDEGGIACRSRYCPVRMYNKAKPNKFRIDYFSMCCGKCNAGLHMEIYQGRSNKNIDVPLELVQYPTYTRAVLVACHYLQFDKNSSGGYRHVAMDNRYVCPELLKVLRSKFKALGTGTCKSNRYGFPKDLRIKKNVPRGTYKLAYDDVSS